MSHAPLPSAAVPAMTRATGAGVEVRLEDLRRTYGTVHALDGLSLTLEPAELVALLGPSGCGKTTALRALAGLEELTSGRVVVDGVDVTSIAANKRDMGMVFQAYSLFPHLTALDNVAFGLRLRKIPAARRRARAAEMLELVGLSAETGRYASQLSGGQQQRVALARALAIEPTVLLLDEPLSALDAKVRAQLREEIRRVQLEVGTTTLFVTHDQEEALAIADRVGVMRAGRLEQIDSPTALYARPASPFVAEFVGLTNRLPCTVDSGVAQVLGTPIPAVAGSVTRGAGTALVRPESVTVTPDALGEAAVEATSFLGAIAHVTLRLPDGVRLRAQVPSAAAPQLPVGTRARVTLAPAPVLVIAADT